MPFSEIQLPPKTSGRTATIVLFILLLGALWAFATTWVVLERGKELEEQQESLAQLTSAVSGQTFSLFRLMETSLAVTEHWLSNHPSPAPWENPELISLVERLEASSGKILSFYVADRAGGLYLLHNAGPGPRSNVAERDYFQAQANPSTRGLYIGRTVRSLVTGRQIIPVSYPVASAGSGVSMVVGVIDLEAVLAQNEQQRPQPNGAIAIVRSDGVILSRVPYREEFIGRNISGSPTYQEHIAKDRAGLYYAESTATDSVPRCVSFTKLEEFPVTVLVSSACDDALANWRRDSGMVILLTLLVSVVSLPALFKLLRLMRDNARTREELHRLATVDELTGLLNRRAFLDAARREFERSRRHDRSLCVIMADLDHFKAINDLHGHATGDAVLQSVGEGILRGLRSEDLSGRLGGEEFCMVLPETGMETALAVAERLRGAACLATPKEGSLGICPSFSMGVAQLRDSDRDFEELLGRADANLYKAKSLGRNRFHAD